MFWYHNVSRWRWVPSWQVYQLGPADAAQAAPSLSDPRRPARMKQPVEVPTLSCAYVTGTLRRPAMNNLNLTVASGEMKLLTGSSASGSTTAMGLIGAPCAIQTDTSTLLKREWSGAGECDRIAIRRQVGFVFRMRNCLKHQFHADRPPDRRGRKSWLRATRRRWSIRDF
jgi:ABC-type glutathione transport system ATPase component